MASSNNALQQQQEENDSAKYEKEENNHKNQPSQPQEEEEGEHQPQDGIWIGIDLGTTNCVAAIWDCAKSKSKLLRLGGYYNLASPPPSNTMKKGRIVPSALLFLDDDAVMEKEDVPKEQQNISVENEYNKRKTNVVVGYAAMKLLQHSIEEEEDSELISGAMVTSMKRILGMTTKQVQNLENDDFLKSLPFQTILVDVDNETSQNDDNKDDKRKKENEEADEEEGIMIQVKPIPKNKNSTSKNEKDIAILTITPIQIVSILLQSIRLASDQFLKSPKGSTLHPPGKTAENKMKIKNCVIGVPAHFGRTQRNAVIKAAKRAGFDGVVSTITESTAAAMAYGLHISPPVTTNDDGDVKVSDDDAEQSKNEEESVRSVLVFDMGGGTTDVTIANMSFSTNMSSGEKEEERFKVIATAGDRNLGGDNMDEALVDSVLNSLSQNNDSTEKLSSSLTVGEKRRLYQECRNAKERLCGGGADNKDPPPQEATEVKFGKDVIKVTQDDFEKAISPLVLSAQHVVEEALISYSSTYGKNENDNDEEPISAKKVKIDEVVLVGGATRVPAIRQMLRKKFPPPNPPDLCCSVNAEAAVAQGCAIRAAFLSKLVPRHELRSALMLDALPHSIGVLVKHNNNDQDDDDDGHFVPILKKDSPLPAMNYATFTLADIYQKGVSVIAVEDVGDEFPLQRIGTFNFLLHKLMDDEIKQLEGKDGQMRRTVDIGMTVETSGRFIVSIFDSNDPEHIVKKRRYQEQKRAQKKQEQGEETTIGYDGDDDGQNAESFSEKMAEGGKDSIPMEQVYLTIICVLMFLLYAGARIAFSEPPTEESARII